ncbi:MAG: porin family protein [Bacteroidota bacterium]
MKKLLFALQLFFLGSIITWSQVSVGPKLSLSFSNVIGGENSVGNKFKVGFSAGAFLKFQISDHVYLQPEVVYSTRGFKYVSSVGNQDTNLKHTLSYIDFPFLIGIQIGENGFINFGPQIGYLVNDKIKGVVTNSSSSLNLNSSNVYGYNVTEYALAFGGGYRFPFNLMVAVHGVYGLTKLYSNGGDLSHNFTFGLSVAYSLGEKRRKQRTRH